MSTMVYESCLFDDCFFGLFHLTPPHDTGTMVTLAVYALHHHPDVWENPEVSQLVICPGVSKVSLMPYSLLCNVHVECE